MMNHAKETNLSIRRILVLVDPDQVLHAPLQDSGVLQRAIQLAQTSGAELELFHPYHDASLELGLFANREEVNLEKERVTNHAATRMAELALQLKSSGVSARHEVRWDHPPADAILRKIADSRADLVIKETRAPDYIMGLADHSDWELIRNSPAHLWFVKEGAPLTGTILTAVGGTAWEEGIMTPSDFEVFEVGNSIADKINAQNRPIHCYEVPRVEAYASYEPLFAGMTSISRRNWEDVARLHGQAIDDFAEHFGINRDQVLVSKGHPAEVMPEMARELSAGLLVMGARNMGRWQRVFNPVTAEPVLSDAPCDVLFVKESDNVEIPEATEKPTSGVPEVDLEMAITNPENVFKSPRAVIENNQLTSDLRERILELWDLDVRARLTLEDEGGSVKSSPAGLLKEIKNAKIALAEKESRRAG
ncbi:MAG: universal stress protein [Lysobacterales bacterium]